GRRGAVDLHGPDDSTAAARDQHVPRAGADAGQDAFDPERPRLVDRERDDEADAGAVVDDRVQYIGEGVDVFVQRRKTAIGRPLFDWKSDDVHEPLTGGRWRRGIVPRACRSSESGSIR